MIHILKYIKGAPCQGLLFEDKGHIQVIGYTNVDWVGCPSNRQSTSRHCIFIGGNLVSLKSKKQDVIAKSSKILSYGFGHVNLYG